MLLNKLLSGTPKLTAYYSEYNRLVMCSFFIYKLISGFINHSLYGACIYSNGYREVLCAL